MQEGPRACSCMRRPASSRERRVERRAGVEATARNLVCEPAGIDTRRDLRTRAAHVPHCQRTIDAVRPDSGGHLSNHLVAVKNWLGPERPGVGILDEEEHKAPPRTLSRTSWPVPVTTR